jgi:hypothetical protein
MSNYETNTRGQSHLVGRQRRQPGIRKANSLVAQQLTAEDVSRPALFGPYSVFIPSIHRDIDNKSMQELLKHIGEIDRVDWVEMIPYKNEFRRAYVHFNMCNKEEIIENGCYDIIRKSDGAHKTYFFTLLETKNPIKETTLNIHQVANNLLLMEKTIKEHEERIANLENIVQYQMVQLADQKNTIQQLEVELSIPPPLILKRQTNSVMFPFPDIDFPAELEEGEIYN